VRNLEQYGTTLVFTGPSAWTAERTNPLQLLAHGEIEVVPPVSEGRHGKVRYAFRTTKGIAVPIAFFTAAELYIRILGGPRLPPFVLSAAIAGMWGIAYVDTWLRVPMLLMRAAAGELEPRVETTPSNRAL